MVAAIGAMKEQTVVADHRHPYGVRGLATRNGRNAASYWPLENADASGTGDSLHKTCSRSQRRRSRWEASQHRQQQQHWLAVPASSIYATAAGAVRDQTDALERSVYDLPLRLAHDLGSSPKRSPCSSEDSAPSLTSTCCDWPLWQCASDGSSQRLQDSRPVIHSIALFLVWIGVLVAWRVRRTRMSFTRTSWWHRYRRSKTRLAWSVQPVRLSWRASTSACLISSLPSGIRASLCSSTILAEQIPEPGTWTSTDACFERRWYQRHSRHYANLHDLSLGATFLAMSESGTVDLNEQVPSETLGLVERTETTFQNSSQRLISALDESSANGQRTRQVAKGWARPSAQDDFRSHHPKYLDSSSLVLRERSQNATEPYPWGVARGVGRRHRASLPASIPGRHLNDAATVHKWNTAGIDFHDRILDANDEKENAQWSIVQDVSTPLESTSAWVQQPQAKFNTLCPSTDTQACLRDSTRIEAASGESVVRECSGASADLPIGPEFDQVSVSASSNPEHNLHTFDLSILHRMQSTPFISALMWQDAHIRRNSDGNWWLERHGEYRLPQQPATLYRFGDKFGVDARLLPPCDEPQTWYEWYFEVVQTSEHAEYPRRSHGCRWGWNAAGETWQVAYGTDADGKCWEQRSDQYDSAFIPEATQNVLSLVQIRR
ncbi:hypothetical protein CCYA_CCYA07G2023 [Cyanidiococcus yangmingshanensis]|nr:hypothetical protein CCYA_CCYA07G2023 [Cyanidiococcus yangmingshanensis]